MDKILVGVPTLNEKLNISSLILEIFSLHEDAHILVIDDNSKDGTLKIFKTLKTKFPNFEFIIRKEKKGVGSAHVDIFEYAYTKNYNYLVTMDADYTHQPFYIKEFINCRNKADIIIGSRFIQKDGVSDWIIHRKIMTKLGHFLTKFFLSMPEDASGSFRCYNLDKIKPNVITEVENLGYGFFIESLFLFTQNQYRFYEIPIRLPKRTYGESKMKFNDIKKTLLLILKLKFRKRNINNTCRVQIDDSLNDPQNWNTYWDKQNTLINSLYYFIARFYRNIFIKIRLEHFISKTYPKNSKLLHAGCGTGHVDNLISKNYSLFAIDISKSAIRKYAENVPLAKKVLHMSIFKTNFKNNQFDGVYNLGVMEHFSMDEIIKIFSEMKRITKPGGVILIFWPHRFASSVLFLKLVRKLLTYYGKSINFHPAEISLLRNKDMVKSICKKTQLELISYNFSIQDLFVQSVICLRK